MTAERMIQEAGVESEAKADIRERLAEHLAQQPKARRVFDRVMKVIEVAWVALIAGHLGWAIYASINWAEPRQIAAVWFAFMSNIAALLVLVGVHGGGIRAFWPYYVPGSSFPFETGSKAVSMGIGFALAVLVVSAFWGVFAWGMWTGNLSILIPLAQVMGVVVGVGALVALLSDLRRRFSQSR